MSQRWYVTPLSLDSCLSLPPSYPGLKLFYAWLETNRSNNCCITAATAQWPSQTITYNVLMVAPGFLFIFISTTSILVEHVLAPYCLLLQTFLKCNHCNVWRNVQGDLWTVRKGKDTRFAITVLLSLTLCRIIAAFTECIVSD